MTMTVHNGSGDVVERWLREDARHTLDDNGFTARVLGALPAGPLRDTLNGGGHCLHICASGTDCSNGYVCVSNPNGPGKACFVENGTRRARKMDSRD